MARPRKYASAAERQAAYKLRARQRAAVAAPEDGDGVPGPPPAETTTPQPAILDTAAPGWPDVDTVSARTEPGAVKNEAAGDSVYKEGNKEHECEFKERLGRCNAAHRQMYADLKEALAGPQSYVALRGAIGRLLEQMEAR